MAKRRLPPPTDAELVLLRILWQRGPSTVREVHEEVSRIRPVCYTTVLKTLQVMHEKELVTRDERQRAHVYGARVAKENTQRRLVRKLLDGIFGGSHYQLVMQALQARDASSEELEQIRKLLDQRVEGGQ